MTSRALGFVEVIGFVAAVEAADVALKAANVELLGIAKVDGGIVTVELLGNVDAVKASVEAGGAAAKKVGTLRATHVIARADESVMMMLMLKKNNIKQILNNPEELIVSEKIVVKEEIKSKEEIVSKEESINKEKIVGKEEIIRNKEIVDRDNEMLGNDTDNIKTADSIRLDEDKLKQMSNSQLRNLIASLDHTVESKALKTTRKEDLIRIIRELYKGGDTNGAVR